MVSVFKSDDNPCRPCKIYKSEKKLKKMMRPLYRTAEEQPLEQPTPFIKPIEIDLRPMFPEVFQEKEKVQVVDWF